MHINKLKFAYRWFVIGEDGKLKVPPSYMYYDHQTLYLDYHGNGYPNEATAQEALEEFLRYKQSWEDEEYVLMKVFRTDRD